MSSSPEGGTTGASGPRRLSTGPLAGLLILVVVAVLVVLNLLEAPATAVSREQFDALLERGVVAEVWIGAGRLEARLTGPVRFRGERQLVDRVVAELKVRPSDDEVGRWRAAGARLSAEPPKRQPDWPWGGAVALLLAGGIWHLVAQARRHRRLGSPRQRLEEADRQYRDGELSRDQYEQLVSELTAQL